MTLAQIQSFLAIAREKNLSRAAARLHLSQSAISSQLKGIEEELGLALFERHARGMRLSDGGQILLAYAEEVMAACASLQRCAAGLSRGISFSVTIGLNTDPTFLQVTAINKRLSLLHPDLNIIFHASETLTTAQRLKDGTIDLGFYYNDLNDPDIVELTLANVRVCVAIPVALTAGADPLRWEDLTALPWVWVDNKFPFYQALVKKIGPLTSAPKQIVTAANEQIVHELVAAGQGVALMREDEARVLAAQGTVRIWDAGWCDVPLKLGWLRAKDDVKPISKVRHLIAYLWSRQAIDESENLSEKFWV